MIPLLILFLIGTAIAAIIFLFKFLNSRERALLFESDLKKINKKQEREINEWNKSADEWDERSAEFESQIKRLSKYRGIADADERANKLLQVSDAKSKRMIQEAKDKALEISRKAQVELDKANAGSKNIISDAKRKAEEIAGDAYEALKNKTVYEEIARAMKNIIEGYGDQYILPTHSILDDLAEEFSHKDAAKKLKKAKNRTNNMILMGTAATCDYVEAYRKKEAIHFIIDAFDGKVDAILSKVKHDNVGTLERKVKDTFNIANHHGRAFRNARITDEYLKARLDELKWASVVHMLKVQEREEQRRIKEQLREEARARREYEKAMREAAKEEKMLHKAMEKAQAQIEKATSEQKVIFEQKLRELQEKLVEAEERNKRAMSMAQLTRRGHVYIISNIGSLGENIYKIGLTRRLEPLDRVKELGDSSVPFSFDVHAMILNDNAPALENKLHKHFVLNQLNKVNHRKEFFRANLKEIREEIEKMGLEVKWTMTAEATEYRETLAIEKAIEENPKLKEDWLNRQLTLDPVDVEAFATSGEIEDN
jgi:hypothetical protein